MQNYTALLVPETTYHIYNRANGNEKLFREAENYEYFLKKYIEYISPIADTFCYCLMPNHFHFLIRIKNEETIGQHLFATLTGFKTLSGFATNQQKHVSQHLSRQFSHFFNGYTQAFNKQHNRKGNLLMRPFKRIAVKDSEYRRNVVIYIHQNPLHAGLCQDLNSWPYSSYASLLDEKTSFLNIKETITWFDDLNNFIHSHRQLSEETDIVIKP